MSLSLAVATEGSATVVRAAGRLDAVTAKTLENALAAPDVAASSRLVLDLSGIDYVSSFGLRVILMTAKRHGVPGKRFAVAGMTKPVADVFTMSGFHKVITMAETTDAAVALVQA